MREPVRAGEPFQRVRVIERARTRWKVAWVDPNPGLVDYVKPANLICEWRERRAFLRDEQRMIEVRDRSDDWPGHDHPLTWAVDTVLESTGEGGLGLDNHGVLSMSPDEFDRIAARASFRLPDYAPVFTDRHGMMHLAFGPASSIAKAFAASEPNTVNVHIEIQQRKYEVEVAEPGSAHLLPLLETWRASWAVCRQWAGFDEALAGRDREIGRLREIVQRTVWELRAEGQTEAAARLERRAGGR